MEKKKGLIKNILSFRVMKWLIGLYGLAVIVWGLYISSFPDQFNVERAALRLSKSEVNLVEGMYLAGTTLELAKVLLEKDGGYLSNDYFPPGIYLDNMKNFEFGVLVQIRDVMRYLRKDFSRSQSQSTEDENLSKSEPFFSFNNESWLIPSSESEYKKGIKFLRNYIEALSKENANFYSRADNLVNYFNEVKMRLGSLSGILGASVGGERAFKEKGDHPSIGSKYVKTDWWSVDDNFYFAKGQTFALIHLLKAIELDFEDILRKKEAKVGLSQIIKELEHTQQTVWSPLILNGSGFGVLANHSLSMASFISRSNQALTDLIYLLSNG